MRIIPFEVDFDISERIFVLDILHFDWPEDDTSLFEIGISKHYFLFELFFNHYLRWYIFPKISSKIQEIINNLL